MCDCAPVCVTEVSGAGGPVQCAAVCLLCAAPLGRPATPYHLPSFGRPSPCYTRSLSLSPYHAAPSDVGRSPSTPPTAPTGGRPGPGPPPHALLQTRLLTRSPPGHRPGPAASHGVRRGALAVRRGRPSVSVRRRPEQAKGPLQLSSAPPLPQPAPVKRKCSQGISKPLHNINPSI